MSRSVLLLSALLLLTSRPSPAASGVAELPGFPDGFLRAGEVVRLEPRLPAGHRWEELEIYLLVGESGQRVRLTRSVDAARPLLVFRVPSLPTRSARLLVRAGEDVGGVHVEHDALLSRPLEIVVDAGAPLEVPRRARGAAIHPSAMRGGAAASEPLEWWASTEAPPHEDDLQASFEPGRRARSHPRGAGCAALLPGSRPVPAGEAGDNALARRDAPPRSSSSPAARRSSSLLASSLSLPLRI